MKLVYEGPQHGGLDFPAYGIREWKPGEERDVPDALAQELLERGEFKAAGRQKRVERERPIDE